MPLHHPKEKEKKNKIKIVSVQAFYNTTGRRVQKENKYHNTLEAHGVRTAAQPNQAVV